MSENEQTDHNRGQQVDLYGATLADILGSIGATLSLSQTEIAGLLGISAPMLSHLITGRRVKIGNPVAGQRLAQLRELSEQVGSGEVIAEEIMPQLQSIGHSVGAFGGATTTHHVTSARGSSARQVQDLFRIVAGALDWIEVADLAAEAHPEIAELLRVFGAERADAADAYWEQVTSRRSASAEG